jgi:hypothetical protein
MKVYEMKPNEIGECIETTEGIVITLPSENRVLLIAKGDMKISGVSIESITKKQQAYHARAKYLRTKYDEKMGNALQTPLALKCYKHYGVRLFNNILRDIMSALNSLKADHVLIGEYKKIYEYIFSKYGISFTETKYGAYSLFVRESGLVKITRGQKKHAMYVINHQPEIPKTD